MKLHLFEGIGIEAEYMITEKDQLSVKPIADLVLKSKAGEFVSEYKNREITWSNEIVKHVIELKTNGPVKTLEGLDKKFTDNIKEINTILEEYNCILLPTAMHPLMKPEDTRIWDHGDNSIYEAFNRIFDCSGHGFSNLQSIHINLPFYDNKEFAALHAAIRLVLPIIPGLSASSPLMEGHFTNYKDTRLEVYRNNQKKIPSITGFIIPENVFSKSEYEKIILNKIYNDIKPFDRDEILQYEWLNSRGAIARFDRNTIEIRLLDIQECIKSDLAICSLIITLIESFINEEIVSFNSQKKFKPEKLQSILLDTIKYGEDAQISDVDYLGIFGINNKITCKELWKVIYKKIKNSKLESIEDDILFILNKGTLSSRITESIKGCITEVNIKKEYMRLSECLSKNIFYE